MAEQNMDTLATRLRTQSPPQPMACGRPRSSHWLWDQVIAGLLLGLVLAGCAMAPSSPTSGAPPKTPIASATSPEALAAGAHLYQQHCAACHGVEGSSGFATPLNQHGHAWHHPDSILLQTIRDGTTRAAADQTMTDVTMPSFKAILAPEEIRTLIAFFKASWTPEQQRIQWERTVRADLHPH
jgi:mono/diheme cytochrome c family protein